MFALIAGRTGLAVPPHAGRNYFPVPSLLLQESFALQPSLDLQLALSPGAFVLSFDLQPSFDLQLLFSAMDGALVEPSLEPLAAMTGRAVMAPATAAARSSFVVVFIFV